MRLQDHGGTGKYNKALANAYSYQTRCPIEDKPINPKAFSILKTGENVYNCRKKCGMKLVTDPARYASKLAEQGIEIDPVKIKIKKPGLLRHQAVHSRDNETRPGWQQGR